MKKYVPIAALVLLGAAYTQVDASPVISLHKSYSFSVIPGTDNCCYYDDTHVQATNTFSTGQLTDGILQPTGSNPAAGSAASPAVGWSAGSQPQIILDLGSVYSVDSIVLGVFPIWGFSDGVPLGVDVSFSTTGINPTDFGPLHTEAFSSSGMSTNTHYDLTTVFDPGMSARYVSLYFDQGATNGKFLLDELSITGVPEPESLALLGLGLAGLGFSRRKRV